jgi:hypothetical protein
MLDSRISRAHVLCLQDGAVGARGGELGAVADNLQRAYEQARAEREAMFAARVPELEWAVRNAFDAAELSTLCVLREDTGAKDSEINPRTFWRAITCAGPDHSVQFLCDLAQRYREDKETMREVEIQRAPIKQTFETLEAAVAEPTGQAETLRLAVAEAESAIEQAALPVEQRAAFLTRLKQVEILHETESKLAMHASWKLRFDIADAIFRYVIISDAARESIIETFARLDALATVDLSFSLRHEVEGIYSRLATQIALGDLSRQAPNLVGLAMRAQDVFQKAVGEM